MNISFHFGFEFIACLSKNRNLTAALHIYRKRLTSLLAFFAANPTILDGRFCFIALQLVELGA